MREIKFRAWDSHSNRMVGWQDTMFINLNEEGLNTTTAMLSEYPLKHAGSGSNFFKYMQYTGLKDKNGKEIYEGDILKNPLFKEPNHTRNLLQVYYKIDSFMADYPLAEYSQETQLGYYTKSEDFEIIGNIYENPELLKEDDI